MSFLENRSEFKNLSKSMQRTQILKTYLLLLIFSLRHLKCLQNYCFYRKMTLFESKNLEKY